MDSKVKILIADDHPVFRKGLRMILEADSALEIVTEAEDGAEAVHRLREHEPDAAILDVDMPKLGGFEVARELQKLNLSSEIIFLTMYKDEGLFNQAMDLGVKGYILKDSAITDIVAAVKAAAKGENFISPPLATFLVNRGNRLAKFAEKKPSIQDLTPTELNILKLIAEHKTSRDIGEKLFISPRTVDRHRYNICTKLDIHGINALVKFAIENKKSLF
jgi:DNA-binding NarL/FixJ family response regulator